MKPFAWFVRLSCIFGIGVLLVGFVLSDAASGQVSPRQSQATLRVPDGFTIALFASEPMITNPTAIDVDTHGRVWVAEGQYYRRAAKDPGIDKIKVLEDTDGDGKADKATVFTDDLLVPMSVCVAGTKVYVGESPYLYVYEDKNGDRVADPGSKKVLLEGFGGRNHDHGIHGLIVGPDHKLYMTNGDTGFNITGPDGKNVRFRWGGIIRCNLDGTDLETVAVNFRNPYEVAVDSFGNLWCSDNDNDGLKSVRICWILEGGNYGWFGHPLPIRNPDGSFDPRNHWRVDTPGFVPYVMITGFGSPCGMTAYESDTFGPAYANQFLHCDAGPQEVRCYHVAKYGAGYKATRENIVTTDGDHYFRPDDICVAPDGALYISDWYDGGVGGHAYDNPNQGRIYKLVPKGKTLKPLAEPGPYKTVAAAIDGLKSPNLATRCLAQDRLLSAGAAAIPALKTLAADAHPVRRARALWMLDAVGGEGRKVVERSLNDGDPTFRALAVRILRRHGAETLDRILALTDDEDPEVLREVLLALRGHTDDRATDALIKLIAKWDGSDRYYLEAINVAAEGHRDAIFKRVVEADGTVLDPRTIGLIRILRPNRAAAYLVHRLAAGKHSPDAARPVLEALAGMPSIDAGRAVLSVLGKNVPDAMKAMALSAIGRRLGGAWSALRSDKDLVRAVAAVLDDPALRQEAMRFVAQQQLRVLIPRMIKLTAGQGGDEGDRITAIESLARLGGDQVIAALDSRLHDSDETIRMAALKALVNLRSFPTLRPVLAGNDFPARLREAAVAALSETTDGCFFLLPMIDKKQLPSTLARRVIAVATKHPDTNVRLLYQKFVPESERPKTLGSVIQPEEILARTGDIARGEAIFLKGAAKCGTCHMVNGRGKDIGPDLSQIGLKYERKALLETILQPSKAVAPEYVPNIIESESNGVIVAFILQENADRLRVKTENGTRLTLQRADILDMARQDASLMPELLLGGLTAQDAADLLAYLVSLQRAVATVTYWRTVGPFPNPRGKGLTAVFGPERHAASLDFAAVYKGVGGGQLKWHEVQTEEKNGFQVLDIVKLCRRQGRRSKNIVYYCMTYVDSPNRQPAQLLIGSDDGNRVWLNGKQVNETRARRAVRFGEDKIDVTLKQGRNTLLVKVEQDNGDAGVAAAVAAKTAVTLTLE